MTRSISLIPHSFRLAGNVLSFRKDYSPPSSPPSRPYNPPRGREICGSGGGTRRWMGRRERWRAQQLRAAAGQGAAPVAARGGERGSSGASGGRRPRAGGGGWPRCGGSSGWPRRRQCRHGRPRAAMAAAVAGSQRGGRHVPDGQWPRWAWQALDGLGGL